METRTSIDVDLLDIVDALETPYDVLRFIRQRTKEFGLSHFSVLRVSTTMARLSELSMLSSWPSELINAYDEHRLGAGSPVMRRLARSALCFQFDLDTLNAERDDGRHEVAVDLFRAHGMERGAYFPVHAPTWGAGAIGYSGTREPLSREEMVSLHMFSIYAFDRLIQLQGDASDAKPKLSLRERECLAWTAEGKTSFEIGKIVGISEHTVNYYLNTASGKLNSTNRVQAVAMALRQGLLG